MSNRDLYMVSIGVNSALGVVDAWHGRWVGCVLSAMLILVAVRLCRVSPDRDSPV